MGARRGGLRQRPGRLAAALLAALVAAGVAGCGSREASSAHGTPRVVLLGDSLTQGGAWETLLPGVAVRNLGTKGDTVEDLVARLAEIEGPPPDKLFLEIGTNNVRGDLPVRRFAGRYAYLVDLLRERLPGTRIHLQSVLPCGARRAARVRALNEAIREVATLNDMPYIDLYPAFATADGSLRPQYASDEIHLNAAGYRRWAELIDPWVRGDGPPDGAPPLAPGA